MIGELLVIPFSKLHDADDPHSFIVKYNGVAVGIITDIGIACEQVIQYFRQCNAAFLEANYDEAMLAEGNYPYHLKKRISGGLGHLSNLQAAALFSEHKSQGMSHLILSHLSKNNNTPKIVQDLFNQYAGTTEIIIASRYNETGVYQINSSTTPVQTAILRRKTSANQKHLQLSMF